MFTLGYLPLVQMFGGILGEEINSCLSYLTFINTWILQRPILTGVINYSRLDFAFCSSPTCDFWKVVINGSLLQGQFPKRMLLLSRSWLLLPPSCKSPRNRRSMTSHSHTILVSTFLWNNLSFLPKYRLAYPTHVHSRQELHLTNYIMVKTLQ